MAEAKGMAIETACVHAARDRVTHNTGAVAIPIYQSATFAHLGVGRSTGYDYSRQQNPTREHVEKLVCALEGGADALAFPSGMAAVAAMMELFSPGDEVVATDDLYGGSIRLFNGISTKNGVVTRYADTSDLEALAAAITPKTKAVFVETPTNPMMKVTDIAAVKRVIEDKRREFGGTAGTDGDGGGNGDGGGILLVVDNTFLTPYFMRPIALGADLVLHSGTKYLAGHNDTLAGFLVPAGAALAEKLRLIHKTTGAVLSPFDAFLTARGIKTLALRMERSQANAVRVAEWLGAQPKVRKVYYPGRPDHPQYDVSRRQATGFGAMISFSVDSAETARAVLGGTRIILFAESLGGVETLITYPFMQTHTDVPEAERVARGIDDRLLRLSVGIENADDLIADLAQALG